MTGTRVLVALGAGFVVLGGLVAAVTGPLSLEDGSWLAAFLVLVAGVGQYAMGRAPAMLVAGEVALSLVWGQVVCWNAGSTGVVVGTLVEVPLVEVPLVVDARATTTIAT